MNYRTIIKKQRCIEMEMKRCPKCGKVDTAGYGFCVYCGTEFTEENPAETIKIDDKFSKYVEDNLNNNPNDSHNTNQNYSNDRNNSGPYIQEQSTRSGKMNLLIIIGYILAILGNILSIIVAIYLLTRKDPEIKRHGVIQLAIITFYIVLIIAMFASGTIDMNTVEQVGQMEMNNLTQMMK